MSRDQNTSTLDALRHRFGKATDHQIAAEAGITVTDVRAYRYRRGIHQDGSVVPKGPRPEPKQPPAVADPSLCPGPSVLDAHIDKLGVVHDREMAKIAGVTVDEVRVYRYRHGIVLQDSARPWRRP